MIYLWIQFCPLNVYSSDVCKKIHVVKISNNNILISFQQNFDPPHDKTNKVACVPCKDSDQPGHLPSLIRVSTVRMKKAWVLELPTERTAKTDQTGQMPRLI